MAATNEASHNLYLVFSFTFAVLSSLLCDGASAKNPHEPFYNEVIMNCENVCNDKPFCEPLNQEGFPSCFAFSTQECQCIHSIKICKAKNTPKCCSSTQPLTSRNIGKRIKPNTLLTLNSSTWDNENTGKMLFSSFTWLWSFQIDISTDHDSLD